MAVSSVVVLVFTWAAVQGRSHLALQPGLLCSEELQQGPPDPPPYLKTTHKEILGCRNV